MKTVEIKCDACGRDLTTTSNCEAYRLAVVPEPIASRGGFVTSMAAYQALDRSCHFCDLPCLDKWRDRERHKDKLRAAWFAAWKEEHGTKHDNGMGGFNWSYPSPPEDGRQAREAEYEAAAIAEFP